MKNNLKNMKLHLPKSEESLTNPEKLRVTTCPQSIFFKKTQAPRDFPQNFYLICFVNTQV